MSRLGNRLRTLRQERGLTQQELAVKADLTVTTVARVETGFHHPDRPGGTSTYTLEKLARGLGVPISALFQGDEDDEPAAAHPA